MKSTQFLKSFSIATIMVTSLLNVSCSDNKENSEQLMKNVVKFGGPYYDAGYNIIQTHDSDLLINGISNESISGTLEQGYLMKLNDNGQILWELHLGNYFCTDLIETHDNDIMLLTGNGLQKLSSSGQTLWKKDLSSEAEAISLNSIKETSDGYILCGEVNLYNQKNYDFLVLKTDLNGNEKWRLTLGSRFWDKAVKVLLVDDGYIVMGTGYSDNSSYSNIILTKIGFDGEILWYKQYGSDEYDETASDLLETDDMGFILIGMAILSMVTIRVDQFGELIWINYYPDNDISNVYKILVLPGKGYVISGSAFLSPHGIGAFFCAIDSIGIMKWAKNFDLNYNNLDLDKAYDMIAQSGNTFIATGVVGEYFQNELAERFGDIFILRMNENGEIVEF